MRFHLSHPRLQGLSFGSWAHPGQARLGQVPAWTRTTLQCTGLFAVLWAGLKETNKGECSALQPEVARSRYHPQAKKVVIGTESEFIMRVPMRQEGLR